MTITIRRADRERAIGPMMRRAIGSTNSAATRPWSAPATTFSIATSPIGTGASRRSSISRVQPKSATIGSATDWMLEKARLTASTPGSSAAV